MDNGYTLIATIGKNVTLISMWMTAYFDKLMCTSSSFQSLQQNGPIHRSFRYHSTIVDNERSEYLETTIYKSKLPTNVLFVNKICNPN